MERKPQAVQVRELFSCPTNRSMGRMEGHVKHLYSFKAYLRLLCSYGVKNKEITHPLLCCPLSPSTCSTSFCLFRHPCKIKKNKTKQQSQTDVMFTCKPVIKTSIKASLRSFATQILISKLIVNINSPILGFVSPPMATKCQLHDNYRWKLAMLTTAAQSGIQQSPRQAECEATLTRGGQSPGRTL